MKPRTSAFSDTIEPVWDPPAPEVKAYDVDVADLSAGMKKFSNAAGRLGYEVTFTQSRGPWVHKTQDSATIRDCLVGRVWSDGVVVAGVMWLSKTGNTPGWAAESGMIRSLLGTFTVTQVTQWMTNPKEDPRDR